MGTSYALVNETITKGRHTRQNSEQNTLEVDERKQETSLVPGPRWGDFLHKEQRKYRKQQKSSLEDEKKSEKRRIGRRTKHCVTFF